MDSKQADLAFLDIIDAWLREHLSTRQDGVLAEMVLEAPGETVALLRGIAQNLRRHREMMAPPLQTAVEDRLRAFLNAATGFGAFLDAAKAREGETVQITKWLSDLAVRLEAGPDHRTPRGLVRLLNTRPDPGLLTNDGCFKAYRKSGKWTEAAREAGLSVAEGKQLNSDSQRHHEVCRDTWNSLLQSAAAKALESLIEAAKPILERYRNHKRDSAQLDFDDLIFSARDLLRDHEEVRQALGRRFKHVLVDEFQDTDPLQSEIFWRLCGEPMDANADWHRFRIRPGALFLVGDPKQAIYRFRGADISAYTKARDVFRSQDSGGLLSISTNFRSRASILAFVNQRFEGPLTAEGQPGFTPLDAFHGHSESGSASVVTVDVDLPTSNGKAKTDDQRDAEAQAVASLCAKLIGSRRVTDRRTQEERPCRPGDIALLAPTGTDLWRYEEALEDLGIPVATQAGKGFYRRQEVQDLMAITRVLADSRDTLALGALLRGPLVGLTEERLLDVVWALPPDKDPERNPHLKLWTDVDEIKDPWVQEIFKKLQSLAREAYAKTPYQLLSEAVDVFRVRPILMKRHGGQADRALANIDQYLSLSQNFAIRGLRAFAEAMTAAWTDETRAMEGRPDAQEEAVALFTMHAAKGLEWPIVIPINTMTLANSKTSAVFDRETGIFSCTVLGVSPESHDDAILAEDGEIARERIRLWYVAATRARELLVLPRIAAAQPNSAWIRLIDLQLQDLPVIDLSCLPTKTTEVDSHVENPQTAVAFKAEAQAIVAQEQHLRWVAPSRHDEGVEQDTAEDVARVWNGSSEDPLDGAEEVGVSVRGGRDRGLVLHKLMEEVLTGEITAEASVLSRRAELLIRELGCRPNSGSASGLAADELSDCVVRTLALPEIAELRPRLLAEVPLFSTRTEQGEEIATTGIADALALTADGQAEVIVDWKSDVNPDTETLKHYRHQVRSYLEMTGAAVGYLVLMSTGKVIRVDR
jgi:exodeoxyribonuclease-5